MRNVKNKKFMIATMSVTAAILGAMVFIGAFFLLPSSVHLLEGEEQNFSFKLPISAEFSNENIGVLSINRKPVEGNIHLNLNEPFSVTAEEKGVTKVSLSLFGLIPVKTVSVEVLPKTEVIPCGMTVGVSISTVGVMVLGTGYVNGADKDVYEPAKGKLKSGDLITKTGDTTIEKKEDLMEAIKNNGEKEMSLVIKRNGEESSVSITPVKSEDDNTYKLGIWIRDSTMGLGTVTYYNPQTNQFGALGHGVYDVDTKQLMSLKTGIITKSDITGVKKGEKGSPGEIMGNVIKDETLGTIEKNTEHGLYGNIDNTSKNYFPSEPLPIAMQQEIHEGPAVIRTNMLDNEIREYEVNIESVNHYTSSADKGMVVKITDEKLLEATNGIVQGMSGSPIIQEGKVIGAVTHVFVQDPTKGYGIFIENMLKENMG